MVEVKQEPVIKEEPNDGDGVMNVSRPRVDGRYRANYERPVEFDYDFDGVKDEMKYEEEATGREKDSTPCERSSDSADANHNCNDDLMGDAIDVQPPDPIRSAKIRNGSFERRNKRAIPKNQVAKKQKKHKCHVCNHVADFKSKLEVHLRIHTGEKPYQCDICSKSFSDKGNLNRHKKTHGQFRCSKCNQGFEHESAKINHEWSCNPFQFECDICGYRTIRKSDLTAHMRIHSEAKPFECLICSKSFLTNAHLQRHSMIHINGPPNACLKCSRRFATPEDKQTHELRCQRKSIRCEICSKQFVQQIQLNQHLSTVHSDRFPFQCSKCFGGYATEEAKIAHEDSCGYRQYQCHLCKDYSRSIQTLRYHMRKDHTGERIQCEVCAENFADKSHANHHMKTIHRLKKK